jgi:hypothetical protein
MRRGSNEMEELTIRCKGLERNTRKYRVTEQEEGKV